MVDDLPTGYYLDNFLYFTEFVQNHYSDLLNSTEDRFCAEFSDLSLAEQRLFVRLISRKGPYFRTDKLRYDEIDNLDLALDGLVERGFVSRNHLHDAQAWLNLATKPEVIANFEVAARSSRKAELCEAVDQDYELDVIQARLPFDLVEPAHGETLKVFKLLFFGNLYQDLTEFVLRDLGVSPFEQYPLDATGRYFDQRSVVDGMLEAYGFQELAHSAIETPDINLGQFTREYLLGIESDDPQLSRRYSKIFNRVARQLERESETNLALALYHKSNLTPARERLTRLLAGRGEPELALKTCETIVSSAQSEAEHEFAVNFGARLCKKFGLDAARLPDREENLFPVENICLAQVEGERVETTVAKSLSQAGGVALHVENGLLPGLFGLYFWDIIFVPVRGVFFNPFQRGPTDLFTDQFFRSRQPLIEQRLSEMGSVSRVEHRILDTYRHKTGVANHFVMWRTLTPELISMSLARIPIEKIRAIFIRLMRDLKANRSGFPDLVVFPVKSGYELVEVKGPGDTLQDNQKRWLRFFATHGIHARVLNVTWQL